MEVIDGKVWLWNVSKDIESIYQLDLDSETYIKLLSIGAKFSFGKAVGNDYAVENCNGVYCDNLTIDEIKQAYKKAHSLDDISDVPLDKLFVEEIFLMQGITVESVYQAICKRSQNYYWGMVVQNRYGQSIPIESEYGIYDQDYDNITIHAIKTLSVEEREVLLERIQGMIKTDSWWNDALQTRIFNLVIGDIQKSLTVGKNFS